MLLNHRIGVRAALVSLGLAVGLMGCGSKGQFSPGADPARAAVETALSAWRDGRAIDQVESTPAVRVVDTSWREGLKLESFEILGEEPGEDDTHRVTVKLRPATSKTERQAVYVVHGRDPIWVYLEDDYRRMLNMDNNPTKPRTRTPRRGGGT